MNNLISNVHYFYYDTKYFFYTTNVSAYIKTELYAGTPHIFIDGHVTDDFDDVFQVARNNNIEIAAIHPETLSFRYSLTRLDPDWNAKSLQAYKNVIAFAAANNCRYIHTDISGAFLDDDPEAVKNTVFSNIAVLVEDCKEKDVVLVIETQDPYYQGYIATLEQLKELTDRFESLMVGINYSALKAADESLQQWADIFVDKIRYIRVSDPEEYRDVKSFAECNNIDIIHFPLDDCYLENPLEYSEKVKKYGID